MTPATPGRPEPAKALGAAFVAFQVRQLKDVVRWLADGPETNGWSSERRRAEISRVHDALDALRTLSARVEALEEAAILSPAPAAGEPAGLSGTPTIDHQAARWNEEITSPQPAALPGEALLTDEEILEAITGRRDTGFIPGQHFRDVALAAARKAWEASRQLSGDLGRDMALLAGYEAGREGAEAEARERAGEGLVEAANEAYDALIPQGVRVPPAAYRALLKLGDALDAQARHGGEERGE